MDIEIAQRAGVIAKQIAERRAVIDRVAMFQRDGWLVTGLRVKSKDGSQETLQAFDPLDAVASANALNFAVQVYQQQIDALQAELDAL